MMQIDNRFYEVLYWHDLHPKFDINFFFPRFKKYRGGWFQLDASNSKIDEFLSKGNKLQEVEALFNRWLLSDWLMGCNTTEHEDDKLASLLEDTLNASIELSGLLEIVRLKKNQDDQGLWDFQISSINISL